MLRVALFDVDGTLVDGRVWRGILVYPGIDRRRVTWHYARALPHLLRLKIEPGYESRFRDHWVRGLVRLVRGWSPQDVAAMGAWIAQTFLLEVYRQDVIDLVRYHRSEGHRVILVSTMLPAVLVAIAQQVGADDVIGSRCAIEDGRLTGDLEGPSCVGPTKPVFAAEFLSRNQPGVTLKECAAYADSYSDIPLLESAGQPCAVYPEARLRAVALARGWRIHPAQ